MKTVKKIGVIACPKCESTLIAVEDFDVYVCVECGHGFTREAAKIIHK